MGDDFYVMADDANYYSFLVFNYLKSINKPYLIKNDEAIFYFQKNGGLHKIQNNNSHLHWWALLYNHVKNPHFTGVLAYFPFRNYAFLLENKC